MAWYDDPNTFILVILVAIGLGYVVYRFLKELFNMFR